MPAFEAMAAIQSRLAALRHEERSARASGQRAAFWRAQQQMVRARSLEDLRRYCLDALQRPLFLNPEHENDYLKGYRLWFQMLLRDLGTIVARRTQP